HAGALWGRRQGTQPLGKGYGMDEGQRKTDLRGQRQRRGGFDHRRVRYGGKIPEPLPEPVPSRRRAGQGPCPQAHSAGKPVGAGGAPLFIEIRISPLRETYIVW